MKKIVLLSALCAGISFGANAQGVGFGIKAGYNSANLSITDDGRTNDSRATSSFHAGAYLDLGLAPIFSIQPGLFVSGKGSKYVIGDRESANWTEVRTNPIYLELPVNAVVKLPIGSKSNVFIGAGPYAAMGIAGRNTVKGELLGADFERKDGIEWSNDDPGNGYNGSRFEGNLKRFDFGLNFLGGVQLGNFTVNAQYGLGLADIRPGADNNDNGRYKNRVASISVGFLF
jgi:hypothetical protein